MKKHAFLVPLAVAVAALIDTATPAVGEKVAVSSVSTNTGENVTSNNSTSFRVQTTADRMDSFVLVRSEDGLLFAQHESHSSHSSHASHASHSSHTSSVSLA
jgi:hypothetical protein